MAEACGDDAELRGAVESLIRADAHDLIPDRPQSLVRAAGAAAPARAR